MVANLSSTGSGGALSSSSDDDDGDGEDVDDDDSLTSSNTAVGSHEPMPAVDVDYDDNRRGMVLSFF